MSDNPVVHPWPLWVQIGFALIGVGLLTEPLWWPRVTRWVRR